MKIGGIVTEYNPFHKGHAHQIEKIRELYGADTGIVCVMSGDFVQRGEPAIFSKYARAEAAVRCGADLVIELPIPYSVSSAEQFATGAVHILGRLGVIDYLFFGSESFDLEKIERTAEILLSSEYDEKIKRVLETGCSYPTARSAALRELNGGEDVTVHPNDNLGVEYVKAIKRFGYDMKPLPIQRVGAMHDETYDGELKSGSEIRALLKAGADISEFVPGDAFAVYKREMDKSCGPVSVDMLESMILSRLRMLPYSVYCNLPDTSEGLENKLYKACRTKNGLQEIYDDVKSKRYTHARIRRMVMCAALGITKQDDTEEYLYARVLALNARGGRILRESDGYRSIPVISKAAAIRELSADTIKLFEKNADAHDLYVMAYGDKRMRTGERDWQTSPVYIK